ncbi:hypothetical protein [Tunturibacter empetritectus]|uniref:Uncharacterized protein n=1 Tax=Tunturiibacter lichenicola TaxID=2051959 RepID=A0A7W8JAS9_9BACT|nr:hypothetical protein [Edaphobacter lichenicola]MBB5345819.1 hypothetical protein [Edaphobacter lichenicola]
MSSSPVQTDVLKNGRSEGQFLLFTGKKTQLDSIANAVDTKVDVDMLAPLLVGMAAAIVFVILYAFLLGKLG